MPNIAKLIRIEPAFDDPELVRAMLSVTLHTGPWRVTFL